MTNLVVIDQTLLPKMKVLSFVGNVSIGSAYEVVNGTLGIDVGVDDYRAFIVDASCPSILLQQIQWIGHNLGMAKVLAITTSSGETVITDITDVVSLRDRDGHLHPSDDHTHGALHRHYT